MWVDCQIEQDFVGWETSKGSWNERVLGLYVAFGCAKKQICLNTEGSGCFAKHHSQLVMESDGSSDICVNGYDFISSEGCGSTGSVFKARKDSKYYAVKMISRSQIENLNAFGMMIQRLEQLDTTNNPNVVKMHEFFQIPLNVFIAMEYCNQGNILQYICRQPGKHLDCFKAVEIFAQILNGFKFLLANQIQHRNLKPQNILMHNDRPKISDYGLYMLFQGKESHYQMREFMSPENYIQQTDQVSHLCDIWGLGVLFFFLLFNTWPFRDFEDIQKFTGLKKPFVLSDLLTAKQIQLPRTFQMMSLEFVMMISEVFKGLFVFENKSRMTFTQLSKHPIFLKVKSFNMEESFLFYLQAERNLLRTSQIPPKNNNNTQTNSRVSFLNNIGLPGVSARSMYSGDDFNDTNNYDRDSLAISSPLFGIGRRAVSKKSQENEVEVEGDIESSQLEGFCRKSLGNSIFYIQTELNIGQKLFTAQVRGQKAEQRASMENSFDIVEYINKPSGENDSNSLLEGVHQSPVMLSSFGKMRVERTFSKRFVKRESNCSSIERFSPYLESEADFENTEEFDSFHREVNNIPEFCILKACKMVQFQFKSNLDPIDLKDLDSYCLSSVISIPRQFPYSTHSSIAQVDIPSTSKRQIHAFYDLEIYRYRFIEETVRLLKNVQQESSCTLLDYKSLVQIEYFSLKTSFFLAKSLLLKIDKRENFLNINSSDFKQFLADGVHLRLIEILQCDLERLYSQIYLSRTLVENQGITAELSPQEKQFFMIRKLKSCFGQSLLQYIPVIFEESEEFGGTYKQSTSDQRKRLAQTDRNLLNEDNLPPLSFPVLKVSSIDSDLESLFPEPKSGGNVITESIIRENTLSDFCTKTLEKQFEFHLRNVFDKLRQTYLAESSQSSESKPDHNPASSAQKKSKIMKLALRIAMCLRNKDVFDKNKMKSLLLAFEKTVEDSNQSSQQISATPQQSSDLGQTIHSFNSDQQAMIAHNFRIQPLVQWIKNCSKNDVSRQIRLLIGQEI